MKFTSLTLLPLLAGVGSALPVGMAKRQENLDIDILQFALTLEHLENVFYKEALQRFSQADFEAAGFDKHFFDNMLFIVQDEEKHVSLLEGAISAAGVAPVAACTYNFGITDINSFVTLSTVLEGVGTSAYLGGAPLLQDKDILTTAGAILVTEALHTSQQRIAVGEVPAALDLGTPLDANSVFTLASSFIVECPAENAALPFTANPGLTVDTTSCPAPATEVLFKREPTSHEAGLVGPEVVPSEVHPPSPEELQAAQQQAHEMAAAAQDLEAKKTAMMNDHEVMQFQHDVQMLNDKKNNFIAKFGDAFNGLLGNLNLGNLLGGNGKVEAAQPCPFLHEGGHVAFNAEAEIPQGSFVSFVASLSVVSVQAQVAAQQASVAVPAGVSGQVYAFITNRAIEDNKLAADAIAFGPAIIEVAPPAPVIDFGVLRK